MYNWPSVYLLSFSNTLQNGSKRCELGLQKGDLESVERAAHSLKSTSGHLRVVTMQELAENIERMAMAEQREAIPGPLHDLEAAFARVAPILEKYRNELDT